MVNHIIKICGIRDADMATKASLAGANFIGIIFHPSSSRHVNLEQAVAIAKATKNAGALPVGVFVNHTDADMRYLCQAADINIVQLHGKIARAHHHLLPKHYQRIYVKNISSNEKLSIDHHLQYLDPHRDFILIDHEKPGQGNKIDQQKLHYHLPFPWLLAGGLSPSNVATAIKNLNPKGVDVSSGVETSKGNKTISLIQAFIQSVRGVHDAG